MSAVRKKIWADLSRRKLQSIVIALVILLSSGAATLALSLLVESDAPYDHAFAQANGAHLTMSFTASAVGTSALSSTAHAHGVTAAAGPWPQVTVPLNSQNVGGGKGSKFGGPGTLGFFTIVGRENPDGPVDRLTVKSGHWAHGPGEIVLSQRAADGSGLGVGDRVTAPNAAGRPALLVVGIAASISPDTDAWVTPGQARALATPKLPLQYQMLYRVSPAATAADLRAAEQSITRHLPAGAVGNTSNYLDVKLNADRLTGVMIPFLLAFSAFALLAAVLIISNVVSGVVIASYREIGVMKSVGFTPAQVVLVLLGQVLLPALVGGVIGAAVGTLGSAPFLQDTAHALGLPSPFTAALPVVLAVLVAVLAVAALAALLPSWRAGRLSAVSAITMGSAPTASRGSRFGETMLRLPLPRPLGLGLGDSFARPARSTMTLGAILIGVATIVFALSLHLSLGLVAGHLIRDQYVQVNVFRPKADRLSALGLSAPAPLSDRQVVALLRADPTTARFVAETEDAISVPGIAEPIPYFAYREPSSWLGYALIAGRWFSAPGEVVAPTRLLAQAHLTVGRSFTARLQGHAVRLRIVGEILDQTDDDLLLRGGWAPLAAVTPRVDPQQYEVALKPGANAESYARRLTNQTGGSLFGSAADKASDNTSFLLLNGVIAGLALVLIAIAVTGVFNTVILNTREKARDVAILKAVGLAPAQVVGMVVASVALLGLVAGALGIPLGLELHRAILQLMGQIASGTNLPASFYDPITQLLLPLLALSGVAVAALGAWIPAQWAAASGVAEVLQTE